MRNAKIARTLGPASFDRETIRGLADTGMSVAQMNASCDDVKHRSDVIDSIHVVDDVTDEPLATMLDLQGLEVRTTDIDEDVYLKTGSEVRSHEGDGAAPEVVGPLYSIAATEIGDIILLDDGRIEATVKYVKGDLIHATIVSGGELSSCKGVNVPGVDLDIDPITDSSYENLKLAAEKKVDYVAAPLTHDTEGVYTINDTLENLGTGVPIIAKIERVGTVDNLDEITQVTCGVVVACGDLDVECLLEEVPIIQKRTIRRAQAADMPVITVTEMLDSMICSRRPTHAEMPNATNVAFDGTDAVMLSDETVVDDHPVRVVGTMSRIVKEVEASPECDGSQEQRVPTADEGSHTKALARLARYPVRNVNAMAVVAVSESGYTARKTARFRPGMPVVTVASNDRARCQLIASWGISVQYTDYSPSAGGVMDDAVTTALDAGVTESGDTIVVFPGVMTELEGANMTNMFRVHVATEPVVMGQEIVGGHIAGSPYYTGDGDPTGVPEDAAPAPSSEFGGEFDGDVDKLAGIADTRTNMTGYPAFAARELGISMVSDAPLSKTIMQGTTVTLHAGRGIVYESDIINHDHDSQQEYGSPFPP